MPNKLVKIIGLEYSGTTLTDLLVSSLNSKYVSLGEVERSVGHEHASKHFVCACGRPDCMYWKNKSLEYPFFLGALLNKTSIVDSSKTRSSLISCLTSDSQIIFVYKSCLSWCISCLSRYLILEVKPWKSSNPLKYVVPFIRIEIIRRLVILLPLEWLLRNILLIQFSKMAATKAGCTFSSISLESILRIYDGHIINNGRNHILRGNKISRAQGIVVKYKPRKHNCFRVDDIFGSIFKLFTKNTLLSLNLPE